MNLMGLVLSYEYNNNSLKFLIKQEVIKMGGDLFINSTMPAL